MAADVPMVTGGNVSALRTEGATRPLCMTVPSRKSFVRFFGLIEAGQHIGQLAPHTLYLRPDAGPVGCT